MVYSAETIPTLMLRIILIIFLFLLLIGSLPIYPYSTGWGYYPSGGAILLIILVLVLLRA